VRIQECSSITGSRGGLIWEVLADDERVMARCATENMAKALLDLLDDTKPFIVIHISGGLVQDVHCSAAERFERTAFVCDEDTEGADDDEVTTVGGVELCIHEESCDVWEEDSDCLTGVRQYLAGEAAQFQQALDDAAADAKEAN